MQLNFAFLLNEWPMIADGLVQTLLLSFVAIAGGYCLGTLLAIARRSSNRLLSACVGAYVEVVRNTPLLVQLFLAFFGLAIVGFKFTAVAVALVVMTCNTAAYVCEILRAGLDSIKPGQWEAAQAIGLTTAQTYWYVALLPATQKVYPALTSQFTLITLATSITSQISVTELTAAANYLQAATYRPFETYIGSALIYLALSFVLRLLLGAVGFALFPRKRSPL